MLAAGMRENESFQVGKHAPSRAFQLNRMKHRSSQMKAAQSMRAEVTIFLAMILPVVLAHPELRLCDRQNQ
jgi:hypothetical protein